MPYYKEGTVAVTNELTLMNFHWEIVGVHYDWKNNIVNIQVQLWENEFRHERSFSFPCDTDWTSSDCQNATLGLSAFANSTSI